MKQIHESFISPVSVLNNLSLLTCFPQYPDIPRCKAQLHSGLLLDLLGNFSASEDPVAPECAEDGLEATLFNLVPALKALDHLPMGMRVL